MTEIYETKDVKATRKIHTCEVCLRKIPKGFSARLHTGKFDGEFFRYYTCNTCTKLVQNYQSVCVNDDEGYIDSQLLADYMNDYECHTPLSLLHKLERGEIKYV